MRVTLGLGQADVEAKTNEIPMFATSLDRIDLAGHCKIDLAGHCKIDLAGHCKRS